MDISKVRKKIRDLSLDRFKIEMNMLRVLSRKKMLYGSVVKKYKACGKAGCKCTRGELHGPFYYLSFKKDKKTKMIFIRQYLWEKVIKLNNNYKKWRKSRANISKINRRILTLLDEIEKASTVKLNTLNQKSNDR
ncbi:MAG: hypothetical protein KJ821_06385 [Actinobacteria bacterium]|nr:hypothetical protein [Actinomycetota bacterium]